MLDCVQTLSFRTCLLVRAAVPFVITGPSTVSFHDWNWQWLPESTLYLSVHLLTEPAKGQGMFRTNVASWLSHTRVLLLAQISFIVYCSSSQGCLNVYIFFLSLFLFSLSTIMKKIIISTSIRETCTQRGPTQKRTISDKNLDSPKNGLLLSQTFFSLVVMAFLISQFKVFLFCVTFSR